MWTASLSLSLLAQKLHFGCFNHFYTHNIPQNCPFWNVVCFLPFFSHFPISTDPTILLKWEKLVAFVFIVVFTLVIVFVFVFCQEVSMESIRSDGVDPSLARAISVPTPHPPHISNSNTLTHNNTVIQNNLKLWFSFSKRNHFSCSIAELHTKCFWNIHINIRR